jgi:hypothetical protein
MLLKVDKLDKTKVIKHGNKYLLPLEDLRKAVLMLTYEPEKFPEGMIETIDFNINEWLDYLIEKEKSIGLVVLPGMIADADILEEQKRQIKAIVAHYQRNLEGRYDRRKWLCKHFNIPWQWFHQPRPGLAGPI